MSETDTTRIATADTLTPMKHLLIEVDLGSGADSIQFRFAKLQLVLAELNKKQATDRIDEITKTQDEAKKCAAMIQDARFVQGKGGYCSDALYPNNRTYYEKCKAIKDFMEKNDLTYTATDSTKPWDDILTDLKSLQERIGADVQQKMVFVQDYMGQYNAYLTGASTAIQQANQTLQTIARGQ
jgi:hypothetical protein